MKVFTRKLTNSTISMPYEKDIQFITELEKRRQRCCFNNDEIAIRFYHICETKVFFNFYTLL